MSVAITIPNVTHSHSIYKPGLIETLRLNELSHEELVSLNLLEILEEKYEDMDKGMKDALIMMLIENGIEL